MSAVSELARSTFGQEYDLAGYASASNVESAVRVVDASTQTAGSPAEQDKAARVANLRYKAKREYGAFFDIPPALAARHGADGEKRRRGDVGEEAGLVDEVTKQILDGVAPKTHAQELSNAVAIRRQNRDLDARYANIGPSVTSQSLVARASDDGPRAGSSTTSLARRAAMQQHKPEWHAPWKLSRVVAGHGGWVRCVAVDPENQWFCTGSADRTIKVWDLASGTLRVTLTGHIAAVRGLEVSARHPYLFSCGEDKTVKCWDLETNKVVRHYHGHLSGVYTLALHPTLDVLVSAGRDGVGRVWDMRTRQNVINLEGHRATISAVKCQEADPQVITGSMDTTVKLWDLAAGKTMSTLTHHHKGVRALALHPEEFTFASASADGVKQWKCPEAQLLETFDHSGSIVNALAVQEDGVCFAGCDDGYMDFYDWRTGHRFQHDHAPAQPGSLDGESGIFCASFDRTGLRLITGAADKSVKIWRPDEEASEETHPLDWEPSLERRRY